MPIQCPDDLPRSPSGRIPQWVIDEANGRSSPATPDPRARPLETGRTARHAARHGSRRVLAGVVAATSLLAVGWTVRDGPAAGVWHTALDEPGSAASTGPSPGREASDQPLGAPPSLATEAGGYRFLATQDDGRTAVAYDPCRPVHFVVREAGSPPGGRALLTAAISAVSAATGLQFIDDGSTDEAPTSPRPVYQPERYGDRWAPVLIAWVDPLENPELAGAVVGQAGSTARTVDGSPRVLVTGQVELDSGELNDLAASGPAGEKLAEAVILHELAHLVGLDHVAEPTELMYPSAQPGIFGYGPGDQAGLAELGRGACVPEL